MAKGAFKKELLDDKIVSLHDSDVFYLQGYLVTISVCSVFIKENKEADMGKYSISFPGP